MTILDSLLRDGRIDAAALTAAQPAPAEIQTGLAAATPALAAAAALLAGLHGRTDTVPALLTLADGTGLPARAAAWALGQLSAEAALRATLANAKVDLRGSCYQALALLAARGKAQKDLGDFAMAQVQAELSRTAAGGNGLGDQACRVLAVLGDARAAEAVQQVTTGDRFADRYELQRLRKAVAGGGRDQELIVELTRPWTEIFADELAPAAAPVAETPAKPEPKAATKTTAAAPTEELDPDDVDALGAEELAAAEAEAAAAGEIKPIDWKTFIASPEATALDPRGKQMIAQLGPMLEQLVARSVGVAFSALKGQELAAVLLQVLPQALPPQYVQAALAPEAINAYHALCTWLVRTGAAAEGADLLTGIALVRKQLQASVRASGILGGPDYRDPAEIALAGKK